MGRNIRDEQVDCLDVWPRVRFVHRGRELEHVYSCSSVPIFEHITEQAR